MVDTVELARFRQQWKEEVSRPKAQASPSSAASAAARHRPYLSTAFVGLHGTHRTATTEDADDEDSEASAKAVRRGSNGSDSELHDKYFPKKQPLPASQNDASRGKKRDAAAANSGSVVQPSSSSVSVGTNELIASFVGLHIESPAVPKLGADDATEGDEELEALFSPLSSIPHELLLRIFHELAITDFASFARLSSVCRSLAQLVATEQQIWRGVCNRIYSHMVWNWKCTVDGTPMFGRVLDTEIVQVDVRDDEDEDLRLSFPSDETEVQSFGGNWQVMLRLRPRIRYGGIYISTCSYHRPGGASTTSITWSTPVHTVTYYRYLRFYPDGTLLSLLSTMEPAEVVYNFSKPFVESSAHLVEWGKRVSRGRWRLDAAGQVDVEIQPEWMERYLFRMQLRCQQVRTRGAGNTGRQWVQGSKLGWEGFWSWNKVTLDLGVLDGRNDKPFVFSRVAAVEREMGLV